jgi:hypothetical protein
VVFNGVEGGAVSEEESKTAAQILCQVITEYWGFGAFYREDVGVSSFECVGVLKSLSSTDTAVTIEFNTVASVSKGTGFNPYTNRRLPDSEELFQKMTTILQDNNEIGPSGPGSRDYFVELVGPNSPYSSVTSFTVIV